MTSRVCVLFILKSSDMFLQGLSDGYVQTHEPAGRSEDDGGDEEGHQFWSAAAG